MESCIILRQAPSARRPRTDGSGRRDGGTYGVVRVLAAEGLEEDRVVEGMDEPPKTRAKSRLASLA
jgi:hypothetical protein